MAAFLQGNRLMIEHKTHPSFQIVKDFEKAIGEYTGAPKVVCVNSCTMALRLCLDWFFENRYLCGEWPVPFISVPRRTYVSVPMQVMQAGFDVLFEDYEWRGRYRLDPLPIWDCAKWFTSGMFPSIADDVDNFICVSFHSTKILGIKREIPCKRTDWLPTYDIEQGGAILHNASDECDRWLRAARFDGRIEGAPIANETVRQIGHHAYMSPATARLGLELLRQLPRHNPPLPNDDYPDLSTFEIFK
jgi:dTDP-4-amino-4,6-dideoxygalactose transaminase